MAAKKVMALSFENMANKNEIKMPAKKTDFFYLYNVR
jgi:hypothetical protein